MLNRPARLILAVTLTSIAALSTTSAGGDHWPLDRRHSRVSFTVTKWGFAEVEGRFLDFSGEVAYNATRPDFSHIEWTVRIATVDTGEAKRDQALQDPEYFDAAHHPLMQFVSDRVQSAGANELDVSGRLTIKGVSKPLTVRVVYGGRHIVPSEGTFDMFKTSFTINRYDFGVVGGRVLGPAISKEVKITLVAAARQPDR